MNFPFFPLGGGDDESMGEYERRYAAGDVEWDPDGGTWPIDGPPEDPPPGFWRTKDLKVIAMSEMTDAHLEHAIAWLRRRAGDRHPKLAQLLAEQRCRSD